MTSGVRLLTIGMLVVLVAGCEKGFAPVTGQVTLNGKPLPGATVTFYPEKDRGSRGVTDAEGRYVLMYTNKKAGMPPGKCIVRITTSDGNAPERLPTKYHENSELTEEVKPGKNVFNFELKTE